MKFETTGTGNLVVPVKEARKPTQEWLASRAVDIYARNSGVLVDEAVHYAQQIWERAGEVVNG